MKEFGKMMLWMAFMSALPKFLKTRKVKIYMYNKVRKSLDNTREGATECGWADSWLRLDKTLEEHREEIFS